MTTNVYNPHVEREQHSACRMKMTKGTNVIQVGWRVSEKKLFLSTLIEK